MMKLNKCKYLQCENTVSGSHLFVCQVLANILFIQQRLPHSHLFLTEIFTLWDRSQGRRTQG